MKEFKTFIYHLLDFPNQFCQLNHPFGLDSDYSSFLGLFLVSVIEADFYILFDRFGS